MSQSQIPTKEQIYLRLHQEGKTLRQWAQENGFNYHAAVRVLNGTSKAHRGESLAVAVALGLKAA